MVRIANTSPVTVNSAAVDDRRWEYFRKLVTVANANLHKWMQNQKQQALKGINEWHMQTKNEPIYGFTPFMGILLG